jgi:uncharacterized phage protein (TIGR02218 family)
MKTSTAGQRAILASRQFFLIDIYSFALSNGTTLNYCGGDADLSVAGVKYSAGGQIGPFCATKDNRAKMHLKVGKDVDTLVFDVLPGNAVIGSLPFLQAVQQGVFDNAELTWSVVPLSTYAGPTIVTDPGIIMFVGRVAEIDVRRSVCTFNIASHLELLNQLFPRDVFQAGCINTLYDASCTLNPVSFSDNGSALAGSTASAIAVTNLPRAAGAYDLGRVTFTSGANNGLQRSIKSWFVSAGIGTLSIWPPLPVAPAPGDTFTAFVGCDKTPATCTAKFNNIANFRGFPYVPIPETAA